MNRFFLQRLLIGASIVMFTACATVQPTQSVFMEPSDGLQARTHPHGTSYRITGEMNWTHWEVDEVQWRVDESGTSLKPGEIERLRAVLKRSIERSAREPAGSDLPRTLRIRAAITDVAVPSPALNTVTTVLLLMPLDRGGVAVEIEAIDVASGQRVAALATAGNGTLRQFKGHFSRLAHAERALERAARDFRKLLDGDDGKETDES